MIEIAAVPCLDAIALRHCVVLVVIPDHRIGIYESDNSKQESEGSPIYESTNSD